MREGSGVRGPPYPSPLTQLSSAVEVRVRGRYVDAISPDAGAGMTSLAAPAVTSRTDVRTIVGGGIKLGIATAIGVVAFASLSRTLAGRAEVVVQSLLILAGGTVFSYAPSYWVRPRGVDAIAWAALMGLLGSVAFTIVDTVVLRPVDLYHWTWDAIGGGSGFWYVPVWWMGSCFLAWLGAWVHSLGAGRAAVRGPHRLRTGSVPRRRGGAGLRARPRRARTCGGRLAGQVTGESTRRLIRVIAWLLTPVVAWAASF